MKKLIFIIDIALPCYLNSCVQYKSSSTDLNPLLFLIGECCIHFRCHGQQDLKKIQIGSPNDRLLNRADQSKLNNNLLHNRSIKKPEDL